MRGSCDESAPRMPSRTFVLRRYACAKQSPYDDRLSPQSDPGGSQHDQKAKHQPRVPRQLLECSACTADSH
jgi:hypothetical protein